MKITIVVPTYNRADLLRNALQSIIDAKPAKEMIVEAIAIDNNSNDDTQKVLDGFLPLFKDAGIAYSHHFEPNQGKSHAVNRGINAAKSDLISILDDDMEISIDWLIEVERIFTERWDEIDFIGGKVLPLWSGEPPKKINPAMLTVIAIGDHGDEEWEFGAETAILSGGHAVIKREIFDEIGLYPAELGPKAGTFNNCEDDIFYHKLLDAKKRGIYCPTVHFYHFVPVHRLTKAYFRQWCFGVGMSWQSMDAYYKHFDSAKLFSVPRYMYRTFLISVYDKIRAEISRDEDKSLAAERDILLFSGFFYAGNVKDTKLDPTFKFLGRLSSGKNIVR